MRGNRTEDPGPELEVIIIRGEGYRSIYLPQIHLAVSEHQPSGRVWLITSHAILRLERRRWAA